MQSQLVVDAAGVDLIEAVLAGFITASELALAGAPEQGAVDLCDEENTPIARIHVHDGHVTSLQPLQALAVPQGPAAAPGVRPTADKLRSDFADGAKAVALSGFPTRAELDFHATPAARWVVFVARAPKHDDPGAHIAAALHTLIAAGDLAGRLVVVPSLAATGPLTLAAGPRDIPHLFAPLGARNIATLGSGFQRGLSGLTPGAVMDEFARSRTSTIDAGAVILFTGLSGSGKSTVAKAFAAAVEQAGRKVLVIDGDEARQMLSAGLGFDRESRNLNVERIGYVAATAAALGAIAIMAPIAPFEESRAAVRARAQRVGSFGLVHISTPLDECERRDRKGLYAKARAGEIPDFTGISSPYDDPTDADITIDTTNVSIADAVAQVWEALSSKIHLGPYRP